MYLNRLDYFDKPVVRIKLEVNTLFNIKLEVNTLIKANVEVTKGK